MKYSIRYLAIFIKIILFSLLLFILINGLFNLKYDYNYQYPREYRDGAIIDIANEYKQGKNPFLIDQILPHNYTYGFIPPLIIGTIGKYINLNLTQITFILSSCLIIFTLLLVGYEIWINSQNILLVFIGAILTLHYLNVGFRPEIYAIFPTILILIISNKKKPRPLLTYLFGTLSILFYYIKPYFILLSAVLFLKYIQNKNSKKTTFILVLSIILTSAITFILINKFWPMYFPQTFINNLNMYNTHKFGYMIKQFQDYFIKNWAISSFLLIVVLSFFKNRKRLFSNVYFLYTTISIICLFSLGQHTGTYMTYFNQLLPIPMVLFITSFFKKSKKNNTYTNLSKYILIIFFIINNGQYISIPKNKNKVNNWTEAINYINQNNPQKSYLSPQFATIAVDNSWPIYDNGQTEVFFAGEIFDKKQEFLSPIFPITGQIKQMFFSYKNNINQKIINKEYSIIVLAEENHQLIDDKSLLENYYINKTIDIPTNLSKVDFWLPKPTNILK
ncbi:MAG: hypothetical protein WC503_06495 [Candidatus Shapirobacteria bacterium]